MPTTTKFKTTYLTRLRDLRSGKLRITKYTLRKSTEHLYYEADNFFTTLVLLTKVSNQMQINILLDAFAIHTRNLFDFFYPKEVIRTNDMFATDFSINLKTFNISKTRKKDLAFVIRKTDRQVVHLTYARNRYSKRTKPWRFVDIGRKMHKTLCAFYDSLPTQYRNWPNIKKLKATIDSFNVIFP